MKDFIFLLLLTAIGYPQQVTIHLVKQSWHTGIVISAADVDTNFWKEIRQFASYKTVDVGWGDAEFYQHPGFDSWLAVKALFYPTPSTLRIGVLQQAPEVYAASSDRSLKILLTRKQFNSLCAYISGTYKRQNGSPVTLSTSAGGSIIFYKAKGNYHAFNTCNTWIAEGLKYSGLDIKTSVITTGELFEVLQPFSEK